MRKRIRITEATDLGDLRVKLIFNDGKESIVDIGAFIRRYPHPQYNRYLDPKEFAKFTLVDGNIVWGRSWDLIFPISQLYDGKVL